MKQTQILSATILVIDDEPRWKELLEEAFPKYRFLGALSGGEGLQLLQKPNEVDVIILDFKMGMMNGIEVLRRIRQISPQISVIMLTGHGSKDIVVEALENHADDFIDKPFKLEEMKQKIEKLLEGRYQTQKSNGSPEGSVLQRVIHFLERNYDKPVTLQDAADVASLSPKYLSRLFKEQAHKSFTQFRITLKMEKAKEMLKNSSLNIGEISDKLGYENAEAFEKMFKKIERCTPTDFRTQPVNPAKNPQS